MVGSCVWRERSWFQCHVRQVDSERLETEFELKNWKDYEFKHIYVYLVIYNANLNE